MIEIEQKVTEVAYILKFLAHPKRFLILCKLRDWPKTVGELEKNCTISQSQLSQFLWKMKDEWILNSEKNWQFVSYSIRDNRVIELVNSMQKIFCQE